MVPELIPVLGSQPASDVSHKPGGRLQLLPPGLQLPPQPLKGLLPIITHYDMHTPVCARGATPFPIGRRRDRMTH